MIFVSGATGLVGSHLLFELCQTKTKIRASYRNKSRVENVKHIFRYYSKDADALFEKIEWIPLNLLQLDEVKNAIKGCTQIYHCAAIVSFNPAKKEETIRLNEEMTKNMIEAALFYSIFDFCHISSIATLGRVSNNGYIDETSKYDNSESHSAYSIGKYKAELLVLEARSRGLNPLIVKPSVIIGPGWWKEGSGKFYSVINNGLPFYTNGRTGFVDVRDVAKAMVMLMDSDIRNADFVISAQNMSYYDLFSKIALSIHKKPPKIKITAFVSKIVWPFAEFFATITRKEPVMNRYTAQSSQSKKEFSGEKLTKTIDFKYRNMDFSISEFGSFFLNDHL
ncbi:MAG: NAD-dependent epimerase/dehydratase family protein [Bacteroidales bacterium]|nr:NAD-dependent epimerase/dehydratase family protein [Bacteroidales bacterium]MDY0215487.1 NAD-dependent epimerase/dehydratase family protein [Bacteroidales bacterium]